MRYYSTGGFSKSLESEDFWERTGRAGGIFALKVDKKTSNVSMKHCLQTVKE
ncbi:MAG: hypothetical protein WC721_11840 [Victivallaceae bacterium]|jgi:hypothetical protein